MRTAFVLSGGANLGASQAGMLQGLYEHDVCPDLFVGTSAGALNAAFAAFRPPAIDSALELGEVWRGVRGAQVFPPNLLRAGLGLLGLRDHAMSAGGLRRLIKRTAPGERVEDAAVPLHLVAVDVLTGDEVLLSHGPLLDSVLASAAIPGVFPPVLIGERLLMDGGVANNTPISHAIALGADRIFVLQAIRPQCLLRPPRGALAAGVTAVARTIVRRLDEDIARYRDHAELIVLPAPDVCGILPSDFSHTSELISEGLRSARALLARSPARPRLQRAA
jgi:NTE family protein